MMNRVGSVIPSAEEIQQLVKDIETFAAKIEKFTLMLSAEERRRTTKMRVRVVPSIVDYGARHGHAPASLAFGFAAFVSYMRGDAAAARRAAGERVPADDHADEVRAFWRDSDGSATALAGVAKRACSAESLWGTDLTTVPGFLDAVTEALIRIERDGVVAALDAHLAACFVGR